MRPSTAYCDGVLQFCRLAWGADRQVTTSRPTAAFGRACRAADDEGQSVTSNNNQTGGNAYA
ncbi:hypothetical protein ABTA44_19355, partial [Acinetobacter baumannii]